MFKNLSKRICNCIQRISVGLGIYKLASSSSVANHKLLLLYNFYILLPIIFVFDAINKMKFELKKSLVPSQKEAYDFRASSSFYTSSELKSFFLQIAEMVSH